MTKLIGAQNFLMLVPGQYIHQCKNFGFLWSRTNFMAQKPKMRQFWCIFPEISFMKCIYIAAPGFNNIFFKADEKIQDLLEGLN
jgi:hypothetical protein